MGSRKVYWLTPLKDECQICQRPFLSMMYDCAIGRSGPWGNICRNCFLELGCSLGLGRGQEYKLQKDGRWLKVKG